MSRFPAVQILFPQWFLKRTKTEWAPPADLGGNKLELKQSLAEEPSNSGNLSVLNLPAPSAIKELIRTEALVTYQARYTYKVCICDVMHIKY